MLRGLLKFFALAPAVITVLDKLYKMYSLICCCVGWQPPTIGGSIMGSLYMLNLELNLELNLDINLMHTMLMKAASI
jgi:hypothetical protein